jgi:hypothetical protein
MPQVCSSLDKETIDQIQEIADREKRSFSKTVQLLLTQALKERIRNRLKNEKKNNTVHNPADPR